MSDPYVSKARGRDLHTLYCYIIHCLHISYVPNEFNVPASIKSQNNIYDVRKQNNCTLTNSRAYSLQECIRFDMAKKTPAFCESLYLSPN